MRIQRTSQIITVGIIVLSVIAIACALVSRQYPVVEAQAYDARRKMFNLTEQLAAGSDRLTAAVRAYAATRDARRSLVRQATDVRRARTGRRQLSFHGVNRSI